MKLLDKITKWFFNTTKIEVNTDWRLVALDLNRELIEVREENKILYQRIADLEKTTRGIENDRTNFSEPILWNCNNHYLLVYYFAIDCKQRTESKATERRTRRT